MKKFSKYLKNKLKKLFFNNTKAQGKEAQTIQQAVKPKKLRPTRNFAQFFEHVSGFGFYPKTIIDVGAARGTPDLYRSFPDAYLVLFEPLKDFVPDIEKILSGRKGEYHICALMSQPGHSTILKSADKFGSSMMHRIEDDKDDRLVSVDVRTLDQMVSDKYESPMVLKTDCQGGDFDVIRGGTETLKRCEIVIMEVSFYQFWGDHHPKPLQILNYMSEKGFVLYDFLDGLFRPYDNALGQIDMVFVKEHGVFRQSHYWAKPERL